MAMYTEDARKMFHSRIRGHAETILSKLRTNMYVDGSLKDGVTPEDLGEMLLEIEDGAFNIVRILWFVELMCDKGIGSYFQDPDFVMIPCNDDTKTLYEEMKRDKAEELDWPEDGDDYELCSQVEGVNLGGRW